MIKTIFLPLLLLAQCSCSPDPDFYPDELAGSIYDPCWQAMQDRELYKKYPHPQDRNAVEVTVFNMEF